MAKKIVIFADGTGNAFSTQASNIWRLFQALDLSNPDQIAYYIEGVGTSSFRPLAILDGATGIGVPSNVRKLYRFLCWAWEPGAEIYMFGFSRGAFTIRTLIAMIESEGLIKPHWSENDEEKRLSHQEMMFYTEEAYRSYRAKVGRNRHAAEKSSPFERLVSGLFDFIWPSPIVAMGRVVRDLVFEVIRRYHGYRRYDRILKIADDASKNQVPKQDYDAIKIDFVGLFDTVEAFGVPLEELRSVIDFLWPVSFENHRIWGKVQYVRHALSLDDERLTFHPLRVEPESDEILRARPNHIKEVWFAGVHSDIGGGYPDDALSFVPLRWMWHELSKLTAGLTFIPEKVEEYDRAASSLAELHDSRAGLGVIYRYAPRVLLGKKAASNGEFEPPIVHHSVIERMVFGWDNYAPVVLPDNASVLLPSGDVANLQSPQGALPAGFKAPTPAKPSPNDRALKAIMALDTPQTGIHKLVLDKILSRRINYFMLVGAILLFLMMPLNAETVAARIIAKARALQASDPTGVVAFIIEYWIKTIDGVGSALSFMIGMIFRLVDSYIQPYLTVLRMHPGLFFFVLLVLYYLYSRSDSLEHDIRALARAVWLRRHRTPQLLAKETGARKQAVGPASGYPSNSLVRKMREFRPAQKTYHLGSVYGLPLVWAAVVFAGLFAFASRTAFSFVSGWGNVVCVESSNPTRVGHSPVPAHTLFPANSHCWASGLMVEEGVPYRLVVEVKTPWADDNGTYKSDLRGIGSPDWGHWFEKPFVRWAFNNWLQPIMHIGRNGDHEAPLSHKDGPIPGDVLIADFVAEGTGELFLFANDVMPIGGPFRGFYEDNRGEASVTLQRRSANGEAINEVRANIPSAAAQAR